MERAVDVDICLGPGGCRRSWSPRRGCLPDIDLIVERGLEGWWDGVPEVPGKDERL